MKVYFSAAITHRDKMGKYYSRVISAIQNEGHEYLEAYDVGKQDLDYVLSQSKKQSEKYVKHWREVIKNSDVAVLEVSFPSTVNMGFEASTLVELGKPVVLLYKDDSNPTFIGDFHSTRVIKLGYDDKDLEDVLKDGLKEAEKRLNRRFTMIISSDIDEYLKKNLNNKGVPMSEYIRELIEKDMEK